MIHVRTRLTADFTVIANTLLQRPGSAVTVGVAGYILSLPDGAAVSIDALCEHFTEGETLISRALRELETDGYLARRVERGPWGRVGTRTFFHDVPPAGHPARPGTRPAASPRRAPRPGAGAPPGDVCAASGAAPALQVREARGATGDGPDADVSPDHPPVGDATQGAPALSCDGADTRRTTRDRPPAQGTLAAPAPPQEAHHPGSGPESDAPPARDTQAPPAPETAAPPAREHTAPPADATAAPPGPEEDAAPGPHPDANHEADPAPDPDPRAEVILASLRLVDRRLILSRRETADLAPAVCRWLAGGVEPEDLTAHLTDRLPARLLARPARILAHRLRELPPPLPDLPAAPPVLPMVTCDGCERAFRCEEKRLCRDCAATLEPAC